MIFIKKKSVTRLAPIFVGATGNSAAIDLATSCTAGQFLIFWETTNTITPAPVMSGFTSILEVISDGASNDFTGHLQWRIAPSNNYAIPRAATGRTQRAVAGWYDNVDTTSPIVQVLPKASNTAVSGVALPALSAFPYPCMVLAMFRMFLTTTVDAAAAGLTERFTINAANAEAVIADSAGVLASWAGATATTSAAQQHAAAVCAIRGALA